MWGRWGLKDHLEKHVIVKNQEEFEKYWNDLRLEVRHPIHLRNNKVMLVYKKLLGFEVLFEGVAENFLGCPRYVLCVSGLSDNFAGKGEAFEKNADHRRVPRRHCPSIVLRHGLVNFWCYSSVFF